MNELRRISNHSEIDYSERRFDDMDDLRTQLEQDLLFVRSCMLSYNGINDRFMSLLIVGFSVQDIHTCCTLNTYMEHPL